MVIHQIQRQLVSGRHEGVDQLPSIAWQVHVTGEGEQGQDAENDTIDELLLPRIQHVDASIQLVQQVYGRNRFPNGAKHLEELLLSDNRLRRTMTNYCGISLIAYLLLVSRQLIKMTNG